MTSSSSKPVRRPTGRAAGIEESGMVGGRLVNQAFEVALLPGRMIIR